MTVCVTPLLLTDHSSQSLTHLDPISQQGSDPISLADGQLRISGTVNDSIVDGPGLRFVVFVQGCPLACVGCHNPNTWSITGGRVVEIRDLVTLFKANPLLSGLTISGGEPTLQSASCAELAEQAKSHGLNVWGYSGFRIEMLLRRARHEPALARYLGLLDVLVDGPFQLKRRTLTMPWRGSTNQRLIDVPLTLKTQETVELSTT